MLWKPSQLGEEIQPELIVQPHPTTEVQNNP